MTVKELIEYLQRYQPEDTLMVISVDIQKRIKYNISGLIAITDAPRPVLCIEIDGSEPFDEEETKCAEECERNGDD